jgi:hypothetical protein
MENDVILNDKKDVCDTFNSFFINVANDIGKEIIFDENNHPSIDRIRKNAPKNNIDFDFKPTNTDTITKLVSKINIKKATKYHVNFLKLAHLYSINISPHF